MYALASSLKFVLTTITPSSFAAALLSLRLAFDEDFFAVVLVDVFFVAVLEFDFLEVVAFLVVFLASGLSSTLTATVSNKVDKVSGKGLSTNDYTTNEKNKLAGIAAGANKTTVDSALSSTSTNPV